LTVSRKMLGFMQAPASSIFMACMTHGWGVGLAVAGVCGATRGAKLNAFNCFVDEERSDNSRMENLRKVSISPANSRENSSVYCYISLLLPQLPRLLVLTGRASDWRKLGHARLHSDVPASDHQPRPSHLQLSIIFVTELYHWRWLQYSSRL
jgi:hypothetical protein